MSDTCFRYDVAPIDKYELTPEGYLRAWATIARTGVQQYTDADGSIRREYRPESEVASPVSLASFAGKAITLEHPSVLLDSSNTKDYQIGFSGTEVVYDNGFVRAVMTITDKDAIERIMRGDAKEVSAGYRVNYEAIPGVTDSGENYDGIQKEISGNHIAVVRRGRAGPQVKLHLDRLDAADPSLFTFTEEEEYIIPTSQIVLAINIKENLKNNYLTYLSQRDDQDDELIEDDEDELEDEEETIDEFLNRLGDEINEDKETKEYGDGILVGRVGRNPKRYH